MGLDQGRDDLRLSRAPFKEILDAMNAIGATSMCDDAKQKVT